MLDARVAAITTIVERASEGWLGAAPGSERSCGFTVEAC